MNVSRTCDRDRRWVTAVAAVACIAASANADTPAGRFVAGLPSESALTPEARELIQTSWSRCDGCDGEEFLIQGLTVLSPGFREALDAYDADDYAGCAELTGVLREDRNPFIAVNAAAFEIKSLVQMEHLLEALDRIETLLEDRGTELTTYSYFAAEVEFLHGFCLLSDLQYVEAANALQRFLGNHPDASQRLTVPARQMLVELANQQPGNIGEVADLMNYCGRRLSVTDTGDIVRIRQERVLELLDQLIDDAEKREKGSGGGSGGSKGRSPANPMNRSQLPGGEGGPEGSLREARHANPGDLWGSMPPSQRQRILQALRDSFPSRYRRLVEQYYEELAKKP